MNTDNSAAKKLALRFVLIIGVVQLFADMTYEGARGIIGPFLGSLGRQCDGRRFHRRVRRIDGLCLPLGHRLFRGQDA